MWFILCFHVHIIYLVTKWGYILPKICFYLRVELSIVDDSKCSKLLVHHGVQNSNLFNIFALWLNLDTIPILERMISLPQYKARPTAALGIDIMYFICWSDAIYMIIYIVEMSNLTVWSRMHSCNTAWLIHISVSLAAPVVNFSRSCTLTIHYYYSNFFPGIKSDIFVLQIFWLFIKLQISILKSAEEFKENMRLVTSSQKIICADYMKQR